MPDLSGRLTTVVLVAAVGLVLVGGVLFTRSQAPQAEVVAEAPMRQPASIVVHISGAVVDPGLVRLEESARVADAVSAAGGALITADLGAINLAAPVGDGDQIVVPVIGEAEAPGDGRIDLNRASAQDLAGLHGIGPVLAERIVAYRDEHGRFESIEDLLDVPGIGEAKLALLRPGVTAP